MSRRTFLFTLESVGKCEPFEAEFYLRVAADALAHAGFAVADAQAIGIDGARGAAIDFPDPPVPVLKHKPEPDQRRLSTRSGQMR